MKKLITMSAVLAAALSLFAGPVIAAPPQRAPQAAGPAISYTDGPNDAYRLSLPAEGTDPALETLSKRLSVQGLVESSEWSQAEFDIIQVDWAPVAAATKKRQSGGYSTSITLTGDARPDGSYVSWGEFDSPTGQKCQVYHFLTPGITAFANTFCGSRIAVQDLEGENVGPVIGSRENVGRIQGGIVTETTTASGTVLTATFDNRSIPVQLKDAGRTLHNVSAYTCVQGDEGLGCRPYEVLDSAESSLSYKI